jgi:hypothetical protein
MTGMTEEQLIGSIEDGDVVADCPAADCDYSQWVSPDDPDGSFSDLLTHISIQHPQIDQHPAKLWPSIKYRKED